MGNNKVAQKLLEGSMREQGDLNKLMSKSIVDKRKSEAFEDLQFTGVKEKTMIVLRESIFKFKIRNSLFSLFIEIRVWRDEILNASSQDVMESYELLKKECSEICAIETEGPKIAFRILNLSNVNAVEVYYDGPNIGTVLYKDWP